MTIKREVTASPSPEYEGSDNSSTPTKSPKKKSKETGVSKPRKAPSEANGIWTPEKREELVALLWTAGVSAIGVEGLAQQLGMTKKQIHNAVYKGQPSNFRAKVLRFAGGSM